MADVREIIRDAAYVSIGFGVLAVQKAQVQRQELQKRLETGLGEAKGGFEKLGEDVQDRLKVVEERLEALGKQLDAAADDFEERLDKALDEIQSRLPDQAKELFTKARDAGKDYRTQVRKLVPVTSKTTAA
jgi:ElaB/YqjD/DUF883 family membrane-anchored ribosome-binding protein